MPTKRKAMSDARYFPLSSAIKAIQVPADMEGFCTSFNRDLRWSSHLWFDGEHVRIGSDGAWGAAPGDWIVEENGLKVRNDRNFRLDFMPVEKSTIDALRNQK